MIKKNIVLTILLSFFAISLFSINYIGSNARAIKKAIKTSQFTYSVSTHIIKINIKPSVYVRNKYRAYYFDMTGKKLKKKSSKFKSRSKRVNAKEGTNYKVCVSTAKKYCTKSKKKNITTKITKPSSPSSFIPYPNDNGIKLTWSSVSSATSYYFKISKVKEGKVLDDHNPSATNYSYSYLDLKNMGISNSDVFYIKLVSKRTINGSYVYSDPIYRAVGIPHNIPNSLTDFPLTIGSFNVKNSTNTFGRINSNNIDLLGTQELNHDNAISLENNLTNLKIARNTNSDLCSPYSQNIFYNTTKLSVLKCGYKQLWKTDDDDSNRYATWTLLSQTDNGKHFYTFNAHFSNRAWDAEREIRRSIETNTLLELIDETNSEDLPVLILGDLNSNYTNFIDNASLMFNRNGFVDADLVSYNKKNYQYRSFHNNGKTMPNGENPATKDSAHIDHMLLSNGWSVNNYLLDYSSPKNYPSDHFLSTSQVSLV